MNRPQTSKSSRFDPGTNLNELAPWQVTASLPLPALLYQAFVLLTSEVAWLDRIPMDEDEVNGATFFITGAVLGAVLYYGSMWQQHRVRKTADADDVRGGAFMLRGAVLLLFFYAPALLFMARYGLGHGQPPNVTLLGF